MYPPGKTPSAPSEYRLHRVEQLSEDGDRDGERNEGLKGRTQDRDSSDGYTILRERRPLERAPKPRSDNVYHIQPLHHDLLLSFHLD